MTVFAQATGGLEVFGLADEVLSIVGIAILAVVASGLAAALYRWYAGEPISEGLPVLFGLGAAALYLNVRAALGEVVAGETLLLSTAAIVFNLVTLGAAVVVSPVGRRIGDRIARSAVSRPGGAEIEESVGGLVARIGRATTVTLPSDIEDIPERATVPDEVTDRLAGTTFVFGGRPSGDALRERIIGRLKEEETIGHVDIEVEGTAIRYLAVGARSPGLGPTLAPGTAAVAIATDPPVGAGPGDIVQVWATDDGSGQPERVATVEVRGLAEDVVTVACDESDADRLAGGDYRLVTLPTTPAHDREFASILRTVEETMAVVRVGPGSPIVGSPIGALDVAVVAVRPADGAIRPIPSRGYLLEPNDTVFAVARPDVIRRLEANVGSGTVTPTGETTLADED